MFFLVVAGGVVLFFGKDWIVKVALASSVKALTGFETTVGQLRLDPFQGTVHVEDLTLLNPHQFEKRIFADIREIHLSIDLPGLVKKQGVRIYELRLDLRELNVEKDPQGVSNVSLLTSSGGPKKEAPPKEAEKVPFYLDRLELTLRRVSYEDRSSVVPQKLSLDMGIEKEVFEGIDDPASIVNIIILKVISRSPLGNLGLDPSQMQNAIQGTVGTSLDIGGKVAGEAVDTTLTQAEETLGSVGHTAKEKVSGLLAKFRSE